MSMLGFDATGKLALGQLPQPAAAATTVFTTFSQWPTKKKIAVAAVATFSGFVAPPPPAQAQVFSTFQTVRTKAVVRNAVWSFVPPLVAAPSEIFSTFAKPPVRQTQPQSFTTFEVFPPQPPPFTGFARFENPIRAKINIALLNTVTNAPFVVPVDTHDGVWVKRKKKRVGPDPIELELAEKASRRAALELAIYGPEVEYTIPEPVFEAPPPAPVDVTELARVIAQAQAANHQAMRAQSEQDEETDLESILREIL